MQGVECRYIDPSYMIRSIPTTTTDRIYCKVLGQGAVHGAFAGAWLPMWLALATNGERGAAGRRWRGLDGSAQSTPRAPWSYPPGHCQPACVWRPILAEAQLKRDTHCSKT